MNILKKTVSLAMAAVLVLGAGAGLMLKPAMAANSLVSIVSVSPEDFTADTGSINISLEINDTDPASVTTPNPVTTDAKVTLTDDSDFTDGSLKVSRVIDKGESKAANFIVEASGLTLKPGKSPANAKLEFKVRQVAGELEYSRIFSHTISTTNVAAPPTTPPTTPLTTPPAAPAADPPASTGSSGSYTVTKVLNDRGSVRYDINNITSGSDATIRQGYYVDMTVRISNDKAPAGIDSGGVQLSTSPAITEMGSFVFDGQAGSEATVISDAAGFYTVNFSKLRYTGNSKNLFFRVKDSSKNFDEQVSVSGVTECITRKEQQAENDSNNNNRPGSGDDDDDTRIAIETPYVIISKYSYGDGQVTAGETFPLTMTFYNTSADDEITNMKINLSTGEGDLMLTSSSNTIYVEKLAPHSSITKTIQVTAKPAAKVQSHNLAITMEYQYIDGKVRKDKSVSESIAIPVVQIDRFQLTSVDIPLEVMLEEENNVTVQFVNKGRSDVYNLTASISGDILMPGQQQNLGNLASGATGSADFTLKPNKEGILTGEIKVTYEDTNMKEQEAVIPYTTEVKTMESMMGGEMMGGGMMPSVGGPSDEIPPETTEKSMWPIYLLGAGAVLLVVAIIVIKQIRKRRKEREDADL